MFRLDKDKMKLAIMAIFPAVAMATCLAETVAMATCLAETTGLEMGKTITKAYCAAFKANAGKVPNECGMAPDRWTGLCNFATSMLITAATGAGCDDVTDCDNTMRGNLFMTLGEIFCYGIHQKLKFGATTGYPTTKDIIAFYHGVLCGQLEGDAKTTCETNMTNVVQYLTKEGMTDSSCSSIGCPPRKG